MPEYSSEIQTKLTALIALSPAERKPSELVVIYWPSGTIVYAAAAYDELPGYENLPDALEAELDYTDPLVVSLIPSNRSPFIDLPKTASIGDDKIDLAFNDLDDAFSTLLFTHGEGIRVEIFGFWPAVNLLLSLWRGSLGAPKEMNRARVKVTANVGFRSPQLQIPRQPNAVSCPFIFGAHLATQAEIDYHQGCPYNRHISGSIGVPGFTDCPRTSLAVCVERLATENYWPGVNIRPDPIPNNQTQGPNLLAYAHGNQSALGQPIRVIFGYRHAKALLLLAFRPEYNNNHPDDAFAAALFEVCKGPIQSLAGFRINDELVGVEHFQQRLGALGQTPTDWSPDVEAFSGTSVIWGRIQTNVLDMRTEDVTGSVYVWGLDNIRLYSDEDSFTQVWTTNRMWCLLEMYCNPQWGYGVDYSRVLIESAIDTADWCDDVVAMSDPNQNIFGGVRSTFNAELSARATQQQIKDTCTAGRIGLPFEWNGKDVFVPLRTESLVGVPEFTGEGANRNIVYDGAISSLEWSQVGDAELTNQWTVNFDDAMGGNFIDTQLIFGDQLQQLRAGRAWGDRSRRVINKNQAAFGVTSFLEAARLGNTLLYLGPLDSGGIANNLKIKFTTWYSYCFNVQPYKLIRVLDTKLQTDLALYSNARFAGRPDTYPWYQGLTYSYFRVMKLERKGDLKVEIEAQLYPQDYYADLDGVAGTCDVQFVASDLWPGANFEFDENPFLPLTEGSILFAFLVGSTADTPDPPEGWTEISQSPVDATAFGFFTAMWGYWHVVTAGDSGIYDFSNGDEESLGWSANFVEYSGVNPLSPVEAVSKNSNGNATPILTLPSITVGQTGNRLLVATANQIVTAPTVDMFTQRTAGPVYVFDKSATAGASGDVDVESANEFGTGWDLGFLISLRCSGSLAPPPADSAEPGDPTLELGQETVAGVLGPEVRIHGTVTFPVFHLPLRADIFVAFEGGLETLIEDNIAPMTGSLTAQFDYVPTSGSGEYCFRVTVETAEEMPAVGGEVTECITITEVFEVFDVDLSPVLDLDLSAVFDV